MPPESSLDTLALVRAAQTGDDDARESLFRRHYPRIRQIVALRLGRPLAELEEYEDVVQDSLIDALRSLDGFAERSQGTFLNWLAAIAENNIRDMWRRGRTAKRGEGRVRPLESLASSFLAGPFMAASDPTPSEVACGHELEEQIERALLQLDDRSRRVIEMRRLCGMSYEEIAAEFGLGGESSARSLFTRAMARLSDAL